MKAHSTKFAELYESLSEGGGRFAPTDGEATSGGRSRRKKPAFPGVTNADAELIRQMRDRLLNSDFAGFKDLRSRIGIDTFVDVRRKLEPRKISVKSRKLLFIVGLHRSGTSLLETHLRTRFQLAYLRAPGVPESEGQFLQDVMPTERAFGGPGLFAFFPQMHLPPVDDPRTAQRLKLRILRCWDRWINGLEDVLVEKSPPHIVRIPYLRSVFEGAKFVIVTRDPRAVSLATQKWAKIGVPELFLHWCAGYSASLEAVAEDCLLVRYEDLCADLEGTLEKIAGFATLSPRPEKLQIPGRFNVVENTNGPYIEAFPPLPSSFRDRLSFRPWEVLGYDLDDVFVKVRSLRGTERETESESWDLPEVSFPSGRQKRSRRHSKRGAAVAAAPGSKHVQFAALHIPKTGGTVLRSVVRAHRAKHPGATVRFLNHEMTLPLVVRKFPSAKVVWFVRDPINRFVSGFNSRKRMGQPRYNVPWDEGEERAFTRFPTPSALAEALSSPTDTAAAEAAMNDIRHLRRTLVFYFDSVEFLDEHWDRIAFIGSQESFAEDFPIAREILGIDSELEAPTDDVGAHRALSEDDRYLSPLAIQNLKKWYDEDYKLFNWCVDWRRARAGLSADAVEAGKV